MGYAAQGKSMATSFFTKAKNAYRGFASEAIDDFTPNSGYGRDAMMSAFRGSGGNKRWGTAGGAALGGGYGAYSDNQSVLGGMAAGGVMGGIGGAAKNFIGKAGSRYESNQAARFVGPLQG